MDLIVQLLSTEGIVAAAVDGFHRDQSGYGGRVLNALRNNAVKARKDAAAKLDALISEDKKAWIDQVIFARDQLIHPEKGMYQLMFTLELSERDGQLILTKAHPPEIDSRPMQQFAQDTLKGVTTFSEKFLALLHEKAVSIGASPRDRFEANAAICTGHSEGSDHFFREVSGATA